MSHCDCQHRDCDNTYCLGSGGLAPFCSANYFFFQVKLSYCIFRHHLCDFQTAVIIFLQRTGFGEGNLYLYLYYHCRTIHNHCYKLAATLDSGQEKQGVRCRVLNPSCQNELAIDENYSYTQITIDTCRMRLFQNFLQLHVICSAHSNDNSITRIDLKLFIHFSHMESSEPDSTSP